MNLNEMKSESLIITCLSILLFGACSDPRPKEVLFIGNSLTYYHDMPLTLQAMLNEKDIKINIHQSTFPGISLSDHLIKPETLTKLNSQNWDYVVLQEATVRVLIDEVREYNFEPAILRLDSLVKLKKGQTILYQSYPVSIYPKKYCYPSLLVRAEIPEANYCSDSLRSSTEEFDIIQASFNEVSLTIQGKVAPVGLYFELCKKKYPELSLFESTEDTHPSALGSYLIACVFFKILTGEKTADVKYSETLTQTDKDKINEIVDSL